MNKPKIVILAGGSNSRFFPLNTNVHKGAIELLGTPFILRTLENLAQNGFNDIIIIQSQRDADSKSLEEVVANAKFDQNIEFFTQSESQGMGNAVLTVKDKLEDKFVVIFPDLINAGDLIKQMLSLEADGVVCSSETDEPWLYGILEQKGNQVIAIEEKPEKGTEKSNIKILGCYLLNQKFINILESLPTSEYNFEDALGQMMELQNIQSLNLQESILSLKYPWHLFLFQELLFSKLSSKTSSSARIASTAIIDDSNGPIIIEDNVTVGDFAKIVGPCYIGENCLIGDYSFVRGSSIEKNSTVGAKTEVVRSIIMDNSTLHFGYLADSIIGPNNKIGAGLITANKRLDRAPINTMVKGITVDTGLKALGIITGDDANVGISTNTMPGVMIGSGSRIHPGLVISKNVDHNITVQKS